MRLLAVLLLASCQVDLSSSTPRDGEPGADARRTADAARAPDGALLIDAPGGIDGATSPDASTPPPPMGGYFVAAGYGGRVMRTTDHGQTWQGDQADVPNGSDDEYVIRDLAYGGGMWLTAAGMNGRIKYSTDGLSWTTRSFDGWIGGLAYADGKWVAAGGNGWRGVSTDGGVTWDSLVDYSNHFRSLALGRYNGAARWVAVGDNGRVAYYDGTNWNAASAPIAMSDIGFGNNAFVAIAGNGSNQYARSTDGGASWTQASFPGGASGIAFGLGTFVVIGNGNSYTSSDGASWTSHAAGNVNGSLEFGDGVFLAIDGWSAQVFSSTNGTTFTQLPTLSKPNAITHVRYGGF